MKHGFEKVIVVGAGPAGLLTALLLAQHGVTVEVLDSSTKLDDQPRATHYGPPAIRVLRRAGLIDRVREQGIYMREVCWRKLNGDYIAGINSVNLMDHPDRVTVLPLNRLAKIIMAELLTFSNASVKWSHKVIGVGQDENKAWVDAETPAGTEKLEADYIVGCDGANSGVRRALFGKEFPGHTWDEQIVATNTYYDFDQFGWLDSQFIIHPEHWYMAARIGADGLWRVTYGEIPGLTNEQLKERLPWKFETMLPGHPKPDQYKVVNFSPYRVHQRCAKRMRVGRFLLAADAAHLCNPFGGLGLTGGIADVGSLIDCLYGIYDGKADPNILDKYDEIRRKMYREIIDPISSDNIKRMYQDGETAFERDPFMKFIAEADKSPETSRELQLRALDIACDMTQFYKTAATNGADPVHAAGPIVVGGEA